MGKQRKHTHKQTNNIKTIKTGKTIQNNNKKPNNTKHTKQGDQKLKNITNKQFNIDTKQATPKHIKQ